MTWVAKRFDFCFFCATKPAAEIHPTERRISHRRGNVANGISLNVNAHEIMESVKSPSSKKENQPISTEHANARSVLKRYDSRLDTDAERGTMK